MQSGFHLVVAFMCTLSLLLFGRLGYQYWDAHLRPPRAARLDVRAIQWGLLGFVALCTVGAFVGIWGWAIGPTPS